MPAIKRLVQSKLKANSAYRWFGLCMLALAIPGCAGVGKSLDPGERFAWLKREPKPQEPDNIAVVWTDTVLNTPGLPPVRGFGGRVMFFDRPSEEQVKVSGKLLIYAYDESDNGTITNVPDRKYVFPASQLEKLYGKTDLGPSYSVWIPWDKAGGERKRISLLARFESDSGSVTISEMSRHLLPGVVPASAAQQELQKPRQTAAADEAVQASFDDHADDAARPHAPSGEPQRHRMTIDTIDLADPIHHQLARLPAERASAPRSQLDMLREAVDSHSAANQPPGPITDSDRQNIEATAPLGLQQAAGTVLPENLLAGTPSTDTSPGAAAGQSAGESPMQANSLPSVWEWAQHRAELAEEKTEQRRRPQAHYARPRPSAQALRSAQREPATPWTGRSPPAPASPPQAESQPASQVPVR